MIGHSPDKADSFALAVYAMNHIGGILNAMTDKEIEDVAEEYLAWHDYL